jgi:hypothetical protein
LHIFPKQFEFVGIDVCPEGNRPAMSKHQLLQHWPLPYIVRNVAKFVGLMKFYSCFIPNFEVRITPLREILQEDYTTPFGNMWTSEASAAFNGICNAILNNPCLHRYDHCKFLVLQTDFSGEGFGYITCQPANNNASLQAMHKCMQGGTFDFMTKDSSNMLHLVAFGCRRTGSKEKCLHSHLGEALRGNYAINEYCHPAFGHCFVWITDCFALKFILSYNKRRPAILRLQTRFMCWDRVIEHRNDMCLTNADYFSWLGANLCYDPLLKEYIQQVATLCCYSPAPTSMPMAKEHQTYVCGL